MRKILLILLILPLVMLIGCSVQQQQTPAWTEMILPVGLTTPGDTLYVDSLEYIYFEFPNLEHYDYQFQIAQGVEFTDKIFELNSLENIGEWDSYEYYDFNNYVFIFGLSVDKFSNNQIYYTRFSRRLKPDGIGSIPDKWSEWNPVGYFYVVAEKN